MKKVLLVGIILIVVELLINSFVNDISILKDYEIKVINRVINKLNTMNCTQISELSHEEAAWKFTSKGKLITYDYADDLLI